MVNSDLSGAKLGNNLVKSKFFYYFFCCESFFNYLRTMKRINNILLLLIVLLLAGCEKELAKEEATGDGETTGITAEQKANALTISEVIKAKDGTQICVKGFLVGATKQSMSNAEFSPSFNKDYTTAIVLADRQSDGTEKPFSNGVVLFPVCLTDAAKGIREAYNLPNHEDYWNRFVYITGTKEGYMSLDGLKKVKAIEIDDSHVVTDEEKATTSEEETEESVGPTIPVDPVEPVEPNNPKESETQPLTVAEAKNIPAQTRVIVEAYIVASTADKMENCEFEAPFNFSNYIVLADNYDNDKEPSAQYDLQTYTDLYPIDLGAKGKSLRNNYNLVDHPKLHKQKVRITGKSVYQLMTMGLYEVEEIFIIP